MADEQTLPDLRSAFDLSGRAAVVTGAASGIGEATALTLASAGAGVLAADLDADGARDTVATITAAGGDAVAHETDVTDRDAVHGAVRRCRQELGGVHVMANVAGIAHEDDVVDIAPEDVERLIDINLKGTLWGCQAALAAMAEQDEGGSIINVSSASMDAAAPGYALYAMTKAAVSQLTMNMTHEAGRHGVRVNTIAPGATITPFTARHAYREDGTRDQEAYDDFVGLMRDISPLKRVGRAQDQAWLILYLASPAARFCTGQVWRANGGQAIVR